MVALYVLEGTRAKRYAGVTNDLERRLSEHRSGRTEGGQVIGEFRGIHTEQLPDYKKARRREKFLKSGQGRKCLKERCGGTRPAAGG